MTTYQRSFLKWAGGKYKLLDRIAQHIPPDTTRTIEPFAGSAVFSLNLGRGKAVVNDLNTDLFGLYVCATGGYNSLLNELRTLFIPANNSKEAYLALRKEFNDRSLSLSPGRKSALFVYLNKHGFNGLTRYNSSGGFNVPFGSYKKVSLPEKELEAFAEKCKDFEFSSQSFEDILSIAEVRVGDAIYADPPFARSDEFASSFTTYTKDGFSMKDHQDLVKCALEARDKGATMIISNHFTSETADLYAQADHIEVFDVGRSISASANQRQTVKECLAIYNGRQPIIQTKVED